MKPMEDCGQERFYQDDEPLQCATAAVALVDDAKAPQKLRDSEQTPQWAWSNRESSFDWMDRHTFL